MTHLLTVTKVADDQDDDVEFTAQCIEPTGTCSAWEECRHCADALPKPDNSDDANQEVVAHGEDHMWIDGYWMTEQGCAMFTTDSARDEAWDVAQTAGIGVHEVDVTYWGDGLWDVDFIRTVEPAAA